MRCSDHTQCCDNCTCHTQNSIYTFEHPLAGMCLISWADSAYLILAHRSVVILRVIRPSNSVSFSPEAFLLKLEVACRRVFRSPYNAHSGKRYSMHSRQYTRQAQVLSITGQQTTTQVVCKYKKTRSQAISRARARERAHPHKSASHSHPPRPPVPLYHPTPHHSLTHSCVPCLPEIASSGRSVRRSGSPCA
jgi:hypothetical protein